VPVEASPDGRISLDLQGKVVGFDDVAAEHLAVSANRAIRQPFADALVPGLAAAVREAAKPGAGTRAWAKGRVVYEPHPEGATVLLSPHPPADPAHVVAELTQACCLADVAAVLAAYGHRLAPSGSISVRAGQTETWVPAAAWGDVRTQPFQGSQCPAIRTGLAHVSRDGDPLGCPALGKFPSACVPVHRTAGTMLLAVQADDPGPATQVALAIQARATHPDWRD
jgi:hypothetical protein